MTVKVDAGMKVGGSSRRPYLEGEGGRRLRLRLSGCCCCWVCVVDESIIVRLLPPPPVLVFVFSSLGVEDDAVLLGAAVRRGYNVDLRAHPVRPPTETNIHRPDGSVP